MTTSNILSSSKYINYILANPEKDKQKFVTNYYVSKDYEKTPKGISKQPSIFEKRYSEDELIKQRKIRLLEEIHNKNKHVTTVTAKILLETKRNNFLNSKKINRLKHEEKPKSISTIVHEILAVYDQGSTLYKWQDVK